MNVDSRGRTRLAGARARRVALGRDPTEHGG
jgi:hypothetical protein